MGNMCMWPKIDYCNGETSSDLPAEHLIVLGVIVMLILAFYTLDLIGFLNKVKGKQPDMIICEKRLQKAYTVLALFTLEYHCLYAPHISPRLYIS